MKYITLMLSMVLMVSFASAQSVTYNKPVQFYYKANPTSSTANDTTNFFSIGTGQASYTVLGTANDSATVIVFYRLRQSKMPYALTGSWTLLDTLGVDGAGSLNTTTGGAQLVGTLALATLTGYDEIEFYVDYLSGTSNAAADGTANYIRLFYYAVKPSQTQN